jgi:hypothetical protein
MPLPRVSGWLIDYRTASAIFSSGSNTRIDHCVNMCAQNDLQICHHEESLFKGEKALKTVFIDDQNCICVPDQDIVQQCINVANNPKSKSLVMGNQTAIYLTAIASCRDYGVISDHRSPFFTTVFDLCNHYGIPIFSADDYFALI